MAFRTLAFFLREVYSNFRKNPLMIAASVGTVMFLVAILGSFLLVFINFNAFKKELITQLELTIYLKEGLSQVEVLNLRSKIQENKEVSLAQFVSKEESLEKLKASMKKEELDLSGVVVNPLPDSFIVRVSDPSKIAALAHTIKGLPGVKGVNYWEKYLDKFFAIAKALRTVGAIIITLLIIATIFIINNTIRLSVFARRREIKIMELVGAAHWFIRGPFILEGMFYGLLGSTLAVFLLKSSYNAVVLRLQDQLNIFPMVSNADLLMQLFVCLLAAGILVGGIGSYVSVSRFLKL